MSKQIYKRCSQIKSFASFNYFFIIATQLLSNLTHNHITMSYYTKYDMNNYYLWEKSQQHKNGEIHKLVYNF